MGQGGGIPGEESPGSEHEKRRLQEMGGEDCLLSHQGAAGHSVLPGANETVGILTWNRVQETTDQRMEEGIIQELTFFCL